MSTHALTLPLPHVRANLLRKALKLPLELWSLTVVPQSGLSSLSLKVWSLSHSCPPKCGSQLSLKVICHSCPSKCGVSQLPLEAWCLTAVPQSVVSHIFPSKCGLPQLSLKGGFHKTGSLQYKFSRGGSPSKCLSLKVVFRNSSSCFSTM